MASLPVEAVLPQLRVALAEHTSAVLQAAPGAGKTTLVPLALRDQAWLRGRQIVMLEPRRLAARAAARRMAFLLDEPVGRTVGYRIRMETVVSAATRIEVVTEGVLTRMLKRRGARAVRSRDLRRVSRTIASRRPRLGAGAAVAADLAV